MKAPTPGKSDSDLLAIGAFNTFRQSRNARFSNQGYNTELCGNQGYNTDLYGNQEFFNQEHGYLGYIDTGYNDEGNIHSTGVSPLSNDFDTMNLESQT